MAEMKGGEFLSGLLVGAVIGAALGLILAPAKGEETRAMIKEKGTELGTKVGQRAGEIGEQVGKRAGELVETGREAIKERAGSVIAAVRQKKEESESAEA